jgi:hypothetical protein
MRHCSACTEHDGPDRPGCPLNNYYNGDANTWGSSPGCNACSTDCTNATAGASTCDPSTGICNACAANADFPNLVPDDGGSCSECPVDPNGGAINCALCQATTLQCLQCTDPKQTIDVNGACR